MHMVEPRPEQRTLPDLLEDVRQARVALRQARLKVAQSQGGSASMHTRAAQQHLAKALRAYEQALTAGVSRCRMRSATRCGCTGECLVHMTASREDGAD